jgi:hypothetical protein
LTSERGGKQAKYSRFHKKGLEILSETTLIVDLATKIGGNGSKS